MLLSGVAKLKSAYKLYETTIAQLNADRLALKHELASALRDIGGSATVDDHGEEVASCSKGGSTSSGEESYADVDFVESALAFSEMIEKRRAFHDPPQAASQASRPHLPADLNVHHDRVDDILAKMESLFALTMKERLQLCNFVRMEVGQPLLVAYFEAVSHPYLIEVPQVVRCFLRMAETDVCMQARLAMSAQQ